MKLQRRICDFATLNLLLLTAGCVIYSDHPRHHSARQVHSTPPVHAAPPAHAARARHASAPVVLTLTAQEREIIRDYVLAHADSGKPGKKNAKAKALPPGLAKKAARGQALPPGWETKLVRGQVMSTELYRQCSPLPGELVVRLPQPPPGTITVAIEGRIVRVARATMEILDVFDAI